MKDGKGAVFTLTVICASRAKLAIGFSSIANSPSGLILLEWVSWTVSLQVAWIQTLRRARARRLGSGSGSILQTGVGVAMAKIGRTRYQHAVPFTTFLSV